MCDEYTLSNQLPLQNLLKKKKVNQRWIRRFYRGRGVEEEGEEVQAGSRVIIQIWTDVSCSFTLQVSVEGEMKDTRRVTGKYDLWVRMLQAFGVPC